MTLVRIAAALLALVLAASCTAPPAPRSQARTDASPACAAAQGAPEEAEKATTVAVLEQAYFCILDNYYAGDTLDHRSLLTAGFVALTQELHRTGRDLPEAVMPALKDRRKADWAAFEDRFRKITDRVPDLRERLVVVTLEAMVASLDDNHARWVHDLPPRPLDYHDGEGYGLGFRANVTAQQAETSPGAAAPPLFVTTVQGGAARSAGLRPGDIIEAINGSAPFIGQRPTPAIAALDPDYSETDPVELRLFRQSTGRRWTVTLRPGLYERDLDELRVVRSKLMDGNVAYVRMRGFTPDSAKRVVDGISRLRDGRKLAGVVLDLRGNGGGSPVEANRLVSAFVHDEVTGYQCTVDDRCEAMRTDDTVDLIELPLVVLVDRTCASACEHFGSAVEGLGIGDLVGTRTAGVISGPSKSYRLDDNTTLAFPTRHHRGPDREVIDRVGVPPDHYVPMTPKDAAAGRDPALTEALALLDK